MKSKRLFSAVALGFLLVGSSFCEISPDSPEITIINKTGNNIPLVRVKVTFTGNQGTVVKGSLHITNLAASRWVFWPGYVKVNALKATRWVGKDKPARKETKRHSLTNDYGKRELNQIDDFTWTMYIDQLVRNGHREYILDVFKKEKKEGESLAAIYVTKIKVFDIIEGTERNIEMREREEMARQKFANQKAEKGSPESFGTTASTFSIIPAEGKVEIYTKYQRGVHLPHKEYAKKYGESGKPMRLIYEIVAQ